MVADLDRKGCEGSAYIQKLEPPTSSHCKNPTDPRTLSKFLGVKARLDRVKNPLEETVEILSSKVRIYISLQLRADFDSMYMSECFDRLE